MRMQENFKLMAGYNQSMNNSVYAGASQLSREAINKDRGAFFGSIIGTLNHILVGDILWLQRFSQHPFGFTSLDIVKTMRTPSALDAILEPELAALWDIREQLDCSIIEFADALNEETLGSSLRYQNVKGEWANKKFSYLIQHFFNHQTHHRGQLSTLLLQAGVDIGVTDLLVAIPEV